MIIVSSGSLQDIADALVQALVSAADHHGARRVQGTIDPELLQRVALGALTTVAGECVWRAGDVITKAPEEQLPWLRTDFKLAR